MYTTEIFTILQWWFMLFLITVMAIPLSLNLFRNFFDKGYIFSKILGICILSYLVFILGILHILPFTQFNIIILGVVITGYLFYSQKGLINKKTLLKYFPIFFLEETLFLLILFFWAYIKSFSPDVHGLEKYMDFGFINSLLRSEYFPPKDMWFTPLAINYYYFGHLVTALLTKLSGIPSGITFNLMLATICALCFTSAFSIGSNLTLFFSADKSLPKIKILFAGLLTAFLVTFSGNLHTLYTLFKPYENEKPVPPFSFSTDCLKNKLQKNPRCISPSLPIESLGFSPSTFPNSYWYPNATRFIHNTIHEFPMYSWVVSDLHGHVLDIPFVLLILGLLLAIYERYSQKNSGRSPPKLLQNILGETVIPIPLLILCGSILAIMYMTNAWDGIIYFLLTAFILFLLAIQLFGKKQSSFRLLITKVLPPTLVSSGIVFACFILFSLPFSLHFKPFVSGIGVLCTPQSIIYHTRKEIELDTLGKPILDQYGKEIPKYGKLGPLLFESNHCQHSPLWQLTILYGFFFFFITSFLFFISKQKKLSVSDIFVLGLMTVSLLLILIPEFIYVKDIYPEHYRANTMFKLVFQSFIMLSIASSYVIIRILSSTKELLKTSKGKLIFMLFFLLTMSLLTLVFLYPFLSTTAYYNKLQTFSGINGTKYLTTLLPEDAKAITWINLQIIGQPVILEAQGDSYTDYGRISTNTGLPTVLGWTVHEWLWRGTYDVPKPRISDIQVLYESENISTTVSLLKKYQVKYIYIGNLEREKYPNLKEDKFQQIGTVVYQTGNTRIYKVK